jgi:uncharacterized membrane protein YdjX (TVP38/TMEM64 family)
MSSPGEPGASRRGRIPRALGALLFLILLTAALAALQAGLLGSRLSPEGVRKVVGVLGWSAPLLFVAGFAVGINLMVPASLLAVGAGLAFGWTAALLLTLAGCLLGFLLGYTLSAALLRQPARALLARFGWLGALERLERLPPVRLSFAARFIPIPVGAQNALLGLARLPIPPYLAGSLAGSLPWMIVFTGMGGTAGGTAHGPFWLAALVGLGLMLASDRWWSRRARRPETPQP